MAKVSGKVKTAILYAVIAVVIIISLLLLMFNSGVQVLEKISGVVVIPIINTCDSALDGIGNFFASFGSRMELKAELDSANERLAELENVQSVAEEVKAENARLLALLNESESYPEFTYKYAKVILRSVDDYSATFTLNKGTKDGIEANMAVIAEGGLAGKIIKADESSSVLLAITDSRCGVPSLAESSRDMGVVKGVSSSGSVQGYLRMNELPSNAIIKPGDTVITSGLGEVFPKGITVGTVTEVSNSGTNQVECRLSPSVDFNHLESVLVIISTGE